MPGDPAASGSSPAARACRELRRKVAGSKHWQGALKARLKARHELPPQEWPLLLRAACQLLCDARAASALLFSPLQCRLWLAWATATATADRARSGLAAQRWSLQLVWLLLRPLERREDLLPAHEPRDLAAGTPGASVLGSLERASRLLARVLTR